MEIKPIGKQTQGLDRYLAGIRRNTCFVTLQGIPQPEDRHGGTLEINIPLQKVYIKLQATEQAQARAQRTHEEQAIKQDVFAEEANPNTGKQKNFLPLIRKLGEYLYRQAQVYQSLSRPEVIDPELALEKHHRLVLLGAPGSGKSTLLRYVAHKAASSPYGDIPILVSLRDYARVLIQNDAVSLKAFALSRACESDEALRGELEQAIDAGRVLWLLDALDEARGRAERVAQQVSSLQGKVMLTSRPVGYVSIGLESLPHFEVLPLLAEDVEQFMRDWFGYLTKQSDETDERAAEHLDWLKSQLDERPRIQTLTRNPLLLTFLVILASPTFLLIGVDKYNLL